MKNCEQCGAPLLDGKCSRDADFDFATGTEAMGKLVEVYAGIWDATDAEGFERVLDHDFGDDDDLRNGMRTLVLASRGIKELR